MSTNLLQLCHTCGNLAVNFCNPHWYCDKHLPVLADNDSLTEMRKALLVAADALEIASDWNVTDVQVNPPEDWALDAYEESAADGWCSVMELVRKLREMARGIE